MHIVKIRYAGTSRLLNRLFNTAAVLDTHETFQSCHYVLHPSVEELLGTKKAENDLVPGIRARTIYKTDLHNNLTISSHTPDR